MPPDYQRWLTYLFDRNTTENHWCYDTNHQPFETTNAQLAELIAYTLENCTRDFLAYSDRQLCCGLEYIFNNNYSDCIFALILDEVPLALRLRGIASIDKLYKGCFEKSCAPVLMHLDQPGAKPLNAPCYMFWDSPLIYWESYQHKDIFYNAVSDLMAEILTSKNPACVESALHGLGHIRIHHEKAAVKIIDNYINNKQFICADLRKYAENARMGNIL